MKQLLLALSLLCSSAFAQRQMSFHNGTFKIAQFTDIHWDAKTTNCPKTVAAIRNVIATEKPDLAVLTGDIVTEQPAAKGWQQVINIFEQAQLPFVVTMGNHDAEVLPKDTIYQLLLASPYYIGTRGDSNISGYGNCSVPLYGANGVAAVLYFLDSNDYQPHKALGDYDWIHADEIAWYRTTSHTYQQQNAGKPLPALAFFHIPLVEYKEMIAQGTYLGSYDEGEVCAAKLNSGMFTAFAEQGDVMGVFTGHDHSNDLIDTYAGIALAYGRVSGYDAYGSLERGGRIIQLYENARKFDSWVRTSKGVENIFYYPSAITSRDEATLPLLPALNVKPKKQGVSYIYYEGKAKKTADIATMKQVKQGIMPNFSLEAATAKDHFAFVFKAFIKIPKRGVYKFYTYSDDGSRLFIDGKEVVNNDGGHSARRAEGKVALAEGYHELTIPYFEDYMGETLSVGYASRDIPEQLIPNDVLSPVLQR